MELNFATLTFLWVIKQTIYKVSKYKQNRKNWKSIKFGKGWLTQSIGTISSHIPD